MDQFKIINLSKETRYLLPQTVDGKHKDYDGLLPYIDNAAVSQLREVPNLRLAMDYRFFGCRTTRGWAGLAVAMPKLVEIQFLVAGDEHIGQKGGWKLLEEGESSERVRSCLDELTAGWSNFHEEFGRKEDYEVDWKRPAPAMSLRARPRPLFECHPYHETR